MVVSGRWNLLGGRSGLERTGLVPRVPHDGIQNWGSQGSNDGSAYERGRWRDGDARRV